MYFFSMKPTECLTYWICSTYATRYAGECVLEDESPTERKRPSLMLHFNLLGQVNGHWGPNLLPNGMPSQAIFNHQTIFFSD